MGLALSFLPDTLEHYMNVRKHGSWIYPVRGGLDVSISSWKAISFQRSSGMSSLMPRERETRGLNAKEAKGRIVQLASRMHSISFTAEWKQEHARGEAMQRHHGRRG